MSSHAKVASSSLTPDILPSEGTFQVTNLPKAESTIIQKRTNAFCTPKTTKCIINLPTYGSLEIASDKYEGTPTLYGRFSVFIEWSRNYGTFFYQILLFVSQQKRIVFEYILEDMRKRISSFDKKKS